MQAHHITLTEKHEVDHLCISLNTAEVRGVHAILCDWVDSEHAIAAADGVNSHQPHTAFATSLIAVLDNFMWEGPKVTK